MYRGHPACTTSCFKPQLFLPLPHHSRFINHSQVLGVVVVDFVHVYLETHCNDCVSRRPFPQHASRIEGEKRKGLLTPVFPLYQIPPHRPYCAIVPVVVCSVTATAVASAAVVPAAVVPAAPVVSEPLDAPPGPVTEVVSEPVSTYTPLKRQSSVVAPLWPLRGRRSTPKCQSAPFCGNLSVYVRKKKRLWREFWWKERLAEEALAENGPAVLVSGSEPVECQYRRRSPIFENGVLAHRPHRVTHRPQMSSSTCSCCRPSTEGSCAKFPTRRLKGLISTIIFPKLRLLLTNPTVLQ